MPTPASRPAFSGLHPSWHWTRRSLPQPPTPPAQQPRLIAMSLIRRQADGSLCWIDVPAGPLPPKVT